MITEAIIAVILIERAFSSIKAHRILNNMNKPELIKLAELINSKDIVANHKLNKVQKDSNSKHIVIKLCNLKLINYGKHLPKPKKHFYSKFIKKLSNIKITRNILKMLVHHHKLIYWKSNNYLYHVSELGFHIIKLQKHKYPKIYLLARHNNIKSNDLWTRPNKHKAKRDYKKLKKRANNIKKKNK